MTDGVTFEVLTKAVSTWVDGCKLFGVDDDEVGDES